MILTSYLRFILLWIFCVMAWSSHADTARPAVNPPKVVNQLTRSLDSIDQLLATNLHDTIRMMLLSAYAAHAYTEKPEKSLRYAKEALAISDKLKSRKRILIVNALTRIYSHRKQYAEALKYLVEALKEINKIDTSGKIVHKRMRAENYMNMGVVYNDMKQFDEANRCYKRALEESRKYKLSDQESAVLLNYGVFFFNQKQYDSAVYYYREALHHGVLRSDSLLMSSSLINLASLSNELGRTKDALAYAYQMLELNKRFYNKRIDAYAYMVIGEISLKRNKLDAAVKELLFSAQMAVDIRDRKLMLVAYEDLAEVYEKRKEFEEAYRYKKLAYSLHDSIYYESLEQQVGELQVRFETEEKDQEIDLLSKDKELAAARIEKETLLRNSLIGAIVCVLLVSGILVIYTRSKQRLNKRLKSMNEQLVVSNNELNYKNDLIHSQKLEIEKINTALSTYNNKLLNDNIIAKYEVLKSKINPHFLFNSLSTLSSLVTESERMALKYIEHFSDLYRYIIETSELQLLRLDKEMKIVESFLFLQQMEFGNNLEVEVNIPGYLCDRVIPPLSMQMAVENAIKHNVITAKDKLKISIYVKDDAVVIENRLKRKNVKPVSTGTGQKNITERYRLVSRKPPLFVETTEMYTVVLPLLESGITRATPAENEYIIVT